MKNEPEVITKLQKSLISWAMTLVTMAMFLFIASWLVEHLQGSLTCTMQKSDSGLKPVEKESK